MKTTKLLSLVICLTFPFLIYAKTNLLKETPAHNVHSVHLDKIIAIVNGDVITQSELNKKVEAITKQMAGSTNESNPSKIRKMVLENMIDDLLKLQLAQRNNMKISEAELDGIIANIAKRNNLTLEQFKKSLQDMEGLSFKAYRTQLREQILISQIERRVLGKDLVISDKDVEKVLRNPPKVQSAAATKYHVLDILMVIPDNATVEQTKAITKTTNEIATKLRQGVELEKLMQEYNNDKQQIKVEDLGWRSESEFPDLFAKDVVKLKTGQTTDPIKAPNGLHLIKLIDIQGAQSQKIKFTKEQAREIAFQQKLEELSKPWLKDLREGAYIKIIN